MTRATGVLADVARHRKCFRLHIIPAMSDSDLANEMAYLWGWIHAIRTGTQTVFREKELIARLRACRYAAMFDRNWDATDRRVKWEAQA